MGDIGRFPAIERNINQRMLTTKTRRGPIHEQGERENLTRRQQRRFNFEELPPDRGDGDAVTGAEAWRLG